MAKFIGVLAVGIGLFVTNTALAQQWKYNSWKSQHAAIAGWVSSQCGPKDNSGIKGFIDQSSKNPDNYDVHVFCRVDQPHGKVTVPVSLKARRRV